MIRLVVDSSADYTTAELEAKNIELVPLNVTLGENTYQDGVNLERNNFYELLTNTTDFPKTAQPSPEAFLSVFEDAKEKGDDVICVLLSSGLSGTCQSAFLAKNMADYDNIHIVDSLAATHIIRVIVDKANEMRNQGALASDIITALEELKGRVKVLAAVDTMEYLYRGGRVSKATAAIGELAKIKPILTVTEDGKVAVAGKCLGKNKALRFLADNLSAKELDEAYPIYTVYAYGSENCEKLEEKLAQANFKIDGRLQIGATIGAHVGPGAFGVIFVEKN